MNAEQKQRALQMLRRFDLAVPMMRQADNAAVAMAALLQELVDAPETEPVGYLYTHVQSGEYHVSDYDDDYRGPERVVWHIEPVYRRTKG